jgi:glycosyltransferase involved in cell wall biosynthesis
MRDYGLSGESLICFAGEDWWYHHPHSKNHILKRLAKNNRVLFINSLTMGLPSTSNPDFYLKIRRKLRSYSRWLRKVPDGLFVMSPITLPFYGSWLSQGINRWLLLAQIRLAMIICRISNPILWVAIPSASVVAEKLPSKLILYQVSDKYDANEDSALGAEIIRKFDAHLKKIADVVLYSGKKLYEEATEPHRFFLEQAVDFDHFATDSQNVASEVMNISSPILGYFGAMDYIMDVALIEQVAKLRPLWNWVFIGLRSNLTAIDLPNIHFLGPKPYQALPDYIVRFDVCVLPWKVINTFTSYGSAIKVREYLATGKPIVMAPLYEYRDAPGVLFYENTSEFIQAVEQALQNDTENKKRARQAFVKNSTWDIRTQQLCSLVQSLLASNPKHRNKSGA